MRISLEITGFICRSDGGIAEAGEGSAGVDEPRSRPAAERARRPAAARRVLHESAAADVSWDFGAE